jgi:hypothetical protein
LFTNTKFTNIAIYENNNLERIENEIFVRSQINSFTVRNNPKLSDNVIFDLFKTLDPLEVILIFLI